MSAEINLPEEKEDMTDLVCSHCEDKLKDIDSYQCKTCNDEDGADTPKSLFCKMCLVVLHIKKRHDVCDYRGHRPKICGKHRILCRMFCEDCKIVFCDECIGPHCRHRFRPSSEKATEVRQSIHEYLAKYEELTKPLKRRETTEKETFEEKERIATSINAENCANTMIECTTKVIRLNSAVLHEDLPNSKNNLQRSKMICSLSERNDNKITELKKLLPTSDGVCIEKFLGVMKEIDSSLSEQSDSLQTYVYLKWHQNWEKILLDSVRRAMRSMKTPSVKRGSYKQIKLSKSLSLDGSIKKIGKGEKLKFSNWKLFNVSMKKERVDFTIHEPYNKSIQKYRINGVPTGVNMIKMLQERVIAAAVRNTLITELFNLTRVIFGSEWKLINSHTFCSYVTPFFAWSEKEKLIARTYDYNKFSARIYDVHSEPKFLVHWYPSLYSYVDINDNITVVNTDKGTKIEVLKVHHQLSQIDRMQILCYDRDAAELMLVLFDNKEGVSMTSKATLSRQCSLNWEVVDVCKYDIPASEPLLDLAFFRKNVYAYTENYVYAAKT